jgi:curli biogenesis system outer membrane secretion channel CsgG
MLRKRSSIVLVALLAFAAVVPPAGADRRPTKAERTAIKRVALKACEGASPDTCDFSGARISTRNARFAWANVVGEGYSGALLKRPTRRSRRFRVVGEQGGGIGECSYWRARAPRPVLRDLRISGLVGDGGDVRNCG